MKMQYDEIFPLPFLLCPSFFALYGAGKLGRCIGCQVKWGVKFEKKKYDFLKIQIQ